MLNKYKLRRYRARKRASAENNSTFKRKIKNVYHYVFYTSPHFLQDLPFFIFYFKNF